jgi:hypothetical protein
MKATMMISISRDRGMLMDILPNRYLISTHGEPDSQRTARESGTRL